MLRVGVAASLFALMFLSACGGDDPKPEPGGGPEILEFKADPAQVEAGSPSTLRWKTSGANHVAIFAGDQAVDIGAASAATGSVEVRPSNDTTYRLVATASNGAAREASTSVAVTSAPAPRIVSFGAEPATVASGGTAVLSWVTEDADSVRVLAAGMPVDLGAAAAAAGSVDVKPTSTTIYTLEASRGEVKTTATATVDVLGAPEIVFTASSDVIDYGASATLSWTVVGATHVVVSDGAVTRVDSSEGAGSVEVSPTNRTTYTLTAEGPGGTSTADVQIEVRPKIESFEGLSLGGPLPIGLEVEVSWIVVGAESVTVTNLDGFSYTSTEAVGSVQAPLAATGVFRITATREGVEAVDELTYEPVPPPQILSFEVSPLVVTRDSGPTLVTVSWSVANVETFQIDATPGGTLLVDGGARATDSIEVPVDQDTTFRIEAAFRGMYVTAEEAVFVVAPARIDAFRALPSRVGAGESFELSWATTGAAQVGVIQDGVSALPIDPALGAGTFATQLASDAQFTLRATNLAGDFEEQTIAVSVGAPLVLSFAADATAYDPGDTIRVDWENDGGTTLSVIGPDGAVPGCTTVDLEAIAAGGCSFTAPSTGGTIAYELVVANGIGQETRKSIDVEVRGGARILSFTRQADRVTVGDDVVVSWNVTTDALGQPAVLTLADDLGGTWSLGGKDPEHDFIAFAATTPGTRTYTLTATSTDQSVATASVTVEVFAVPSVSLASMDPAYDPSLGAPLMLKWTALEAEAVSIFELDADGNSLLPAVLEVDPADLAAGSGYAYVSPTSPTEWLAVATNGAGKTVVASSAVSFVPLEILSFDANPQTVVAGDPSTLSWTTSGASRVTITGVPSGFDVEPSTDAFVDLSTSADAKSVPYGDVCDSSWVDEGCPEIAFPDGFSFPFDGDVFTSARIYVNGFVSFDLARTGESYTLEELPSTFAPYVHLAPFWGDLEAIGNGEILYETGQDAKGNYLVIQWSHYSFAFDPADMNFELIMWDDGDFDFRYATMSSGWPDDALGENGSIGYQSRDGLEGESLTYYSAIPGLQNSGYSFRAQALPPSGTLDVTPSSTFTYDLVAVGWDGTTQSLGATVSVEQPVSLAADVSAADVDQGEPFTISWTAQSALGIEIADANGPVYTATPAELEAGSLTLVASTLGTTTYTITADGPQGTQATATVTVTVWAPFGLDSFVVGDDSIQAGDSTLLTWVSHGAEEFSLTANGVDVDLTAFTADAGTMQVTPTAYTTYTFTVSRLDGRSFSQTRTVRVERVHVDGAAFTEGRIVLGEQATVTWTASSPTGDPVGVLVMPAEMEEADLADPGHAFEDISLTGEVLPGFANSDAHGENVEFPGGFAFPYAGELVTSVNVQADGYLSLNPNQGTNYGNVRLPGGDSAGIALAPFWDDLHSYGTGAVYTELVSDLDGDRFIIQWNAFQYYTSSGAPGANLNFQVVLFPDGSFEYRYGTMSAPTQGRADGDSATIGYQDRNAAMGVSLSYGAAMTGGLSNRTWRFEGSRAATGSIDVTPGRDGNVWVCATTVGDVECTLIHLDVVAPGDLVLTEVMLDPTGGAGDQWLEVRNVSANPIDLEGLEITAGTDTHLVASGGPLVLLPGQYATLSAGPTPGFTPDYVYAGLLLDPYAPGDLSVGLGGTALTRVAWTASWTIPQGASLSLDGAAQTPSVASGTLSYDWWCESDEAFGSGDFGSPGAAGVGCLTEYDVDFYSSQPFIDIATTGTNLPNVISNGSASIPGGIPFAFPFYGGMNRTTLYASYGGQLYFAEFCFFGFCFPDDAEGLVSVYADYDLLDQPGSSVKYQVTTVGGRQVLIVQWTNFTRWDSPGTITFQAQLWEGGDIVFVYPVLQGGPDFHGSEAEISLTEIATFDQLLYSSYEPSLRQGQSLFFRYR